MLFGKEPSDRGGGEVLQPIVQVVPYRKGDVIGGKYEVRDILGKGGFGVVFLVHDRNTSELCALKTFRDELIAIPASRRAFEKEVLLWVNLENHPFILSAQWVTEVSGRLFVQMEYIAPDAKGRVTLANHLTRSGGPLDANQTLIWAIQFCLGMEHARSHGIECHRDIKPANILITQNGTLKIGDFGLAAAAEAAWFSSRTLQDSLVSDGAEGRFSLMQVEGKVRCGTPGYIPPEVFRYEGADIRSDIYSFGLVLWQMAMGSRIPPFMVAYSRDGNVEGWLRKIHDQQMTGRAPQVEGPLEPVIQRCLRPHPSERYGSFQEMSAALVPIWEMRTGKTLSNYISRIGAGKQTAYSWNNKGAALHQLGQFEEALKCYDKMLEIDPRDATALCNKGNVLRDLGRYEEAISCCDKALALDPQSKNAWLNKSGALDKLGRHEEAIRCCDSALTIDPRFAEAWNNKGTILNRLDRRVEAIVCYDKALEIDPRNAGAWRNKGDTLLELKQIKEGVACYEKTLNIDPLSTWAWRKKGFALKSLGRHKEASCCYDKLIECCNKMIEIDPLNISAWREKCDALNVLARHEEALECYNKLIEIAPRDANAWDAMGDGLAKLGQHARAFRCYERAVEIDPRNAGAWFMKATLLNHFRQWSDAAASYRKFIELAPPTHEEFIAKARQELHRMRWKI
jgi:tetratricopeptide (TPR) repeat protein